MRIQVFAILFLLSISLSAQIPAPLLAVKEKLEGIEEAKAKVRLNVDIDFINMPEKEANLHYIKDKPLSYTSEHFVFIPKKGLDFSWSGLFDYQFIAVDRGIQVKNNQQIQAFSIIPDDEKADFSIMTLAIDIDQNQIVSAEVSTKNEGTYELQFTYESKAAFPSSIEASFMLEKVKIPLNFMGSDTDIDRKSMREEGEKTGKVYLAIDWEYIKP